tara:strand:- start:217 stop:900 length:684 start_codon:yes stop_codon:yes gene_type:complete
MKVALIGKGNLGHHLYEGLCSHVALEWYGRDYPRTIDADLILIAVPDKEVFEVCQSFKDKLIAHTAGSVKLPDTSRAAVFYPLYSFSKGQEVDWSKVPLLLETARKEDEILLNELAQLLTSKIFWITSEKREKLHVAAVLVNNFTNHLYTLASDHCTAYELPFDVLHPIMKQGPEKAIESTPLKAQTGPATRGDQNTMDQHLSQLENDELRELYVLMSNSIKKRDEL